MFGIDDPQIWVAYIITVGFALACVLYGILNWNKGGEGDKNGR
jgi:hypothetical protein